MFRSQVFLGIVLSILLIFSISALLMLSDSSEDAVLSDEVVSESVVDDVDDEVDDTEGIELVTSPISDVTPIGLMATGVEDSIVISVESVDGADGYEVFESVDGENFSLVTESDDREIVLNDKGFNESYWYYVKAYEGVEGTKVYSEDSEIISASTAPKGATSTIKTLLKTGLAPMGSTMYIWGGGWNEADDGSGITTMQIGTTPEWREFAEKQDETYDFSNHRYEIHMGLDCSGYLGFINYNILHTTSGEDGYVTWAEDTGPFLADKGLGTYTTEVYHTSYLPGDVLYNQEHLYIVIGRAIDGSVLMMHSSPNGVKLSGTPTPSGQASEAARLASEYMAEYYPDYYDKDENYLMEYSYLNAYSKFQYDTTLIADPDGFKSMTAEEILKDLFDVDRD